MDGHATPAVLAEQKKQDTGSTYCIIPVIRSFRKDKIDP